MPTVGEMTRARDERESAVRDAISDLRQATTAGLWFDAADNEIDTLAVEFDAAVRRIYDARFARRASE